MKQNNYSNLVDTFSASSVDVDRIVFFPELGDTTAKILNNYFNDFYTFSIIIQNRESNRITW